MDKEDLHIQQYPDPKEHTGRERISDLSMDKIIDAEIRGDKAYFVTTTGKILKIELTPRIRELYWEVKIRNRRKAFGL